MKIKYYDGIRANRSSEAMMFNLGVRYYDVRVLIGAKAL
jgi:hypothetical protein